MSKMNWFVHFEFDMDGHDVYWSELKESTQKDILEQVKKGLIRGKVEAEFKKDKKAK